MARPICAHTCAQIETYLAGAPTTILTGFKRFIKFMSETGRMDWGEADNSLRWLRGPK